MKKLNWLTLLIGIILVLGCRDGAADENRTKQCASWRFLMCVSDFTPQEKSYLKEVATNRAKHVLFTNISRKNGVFYVTRRWGWTKFPAGPNDVAVLCSYDGGMIVRYNDDDDRADVKIEMEYPICAAIVDVIFDYAMKLANGTDE